MMSKIEIIFKKEMMLTFAAVQYTRRTSYIVIDDRLGEEFEKFEFSECPQTE